MMGRRRCKKKWLVRSDRWVVGWLWWYNLCGGRALWGFTPVTRGARTPLSMYSRVCCKLRFLYSVRKVFNLYVGKISNKWDHCKIYLCWCLLSMVSNTIVRFVVWSTEVYIRLYLTDLYHFHVVNICCVTWYLVIDCGLIKLCPSVSGNGINNDCFRSLI